jgi:hypothetical protein
MARPITSELIARTGAALADGGWHYTPRQLYYATCAVAEAPRRSPARGEFALAVLLVLVALILLPVRPAAIAAAGLAGIAFALGLVAQFTHRRLPGRLLALSFTAFEALLESQEAPDWMIKPADHPSADGSLKDARAMTILFCDTAENAAAVLANLSRAGLRDVRVVHADACSDAASTAAANAPFAAAAGAASDAPAFAGTVIALHDASPRGCALPMQLLDSGAYVIDAGLRPAWVGGDDVQILEGAPARLPRDLSGALTEDELDWLRSGRRVELAILPPERLMQLVAAAIDYATTALPQRDDRSSRGRPRAGLTAVPGLPGLATAPASR